ncbi:unnamed protein product [Ilex paraguariensis]|uniref:UspA domain-containing protein n=1 Tax=Ilex paraguariensis TaxID=185542 RepID=A0ABC8R577_9AQUA
MQGGTAPAPARKVMVVVDPTRESDTALQYALSHVVLENDTLILLHIENPNSWKNTFPFFKLPSPAASVTSPSSAEVGGGDSDFLEAMRRTCEIAQPKLRVHAEKVEMGSKDKASA